MDENKLDAATAAAWLNWWSQINKVLDFESDTRHFWFTPLKATRSFDSSDALPEEVAKIAEARAQARLAKDFQRSDELRDQLLALGWEARDTKDGQKITRRAGA